MSPTRLSPLVKIGTLARREGLILVLCATASTVTAQNAAPQYSTDEIHQAQTILEDLQDVVTKYYYPTERIGKEFKERCAAAHKELATVHSNAEAFPIIADALASPDARIRFIPPLRSARVDYSWQWRLIGKDAYVTQVDPEGDARKQGLEVGDKIISLEGVTIGRDNYESVDYVFHILAPRPGLRVLAESPGKEPRWLAITSTVRPQRRLNASGTRYSYWTAYELSKSDRRHRDEFYNLKAHLHRSDTVAVWRPFELQNDAAAVTAGLKEISSASALILDLRGIDVGTPEPVIRLLDGIFAEKFTAGTVKRGNVALTDLSLNVGSAGAFPGMVLVLVDSETEGYAEVLARVIQKKQRGVIIGDYTMGRVLEARRASQVSGNASSFAFASVIVPTGEVVMADGIPLDGKGVAPDLLIRPTGTDLAGGRDVVLAKALGMLKQKLSPEDAQKLVRLASEDDDDNEWR